MIAAPGTARSDKPTRAVLRRHVDQAVKMWYVNAGRFVLCVSEWWYVMWGVVQTLLLLLYVGVIVGAFVVVLAQAALDPPNRGENLLCAARVVVFFALTTSLAALLLHSSSYQIYWTASRWHWGESYSPIPATITSDPSTLVGVAHLIPKSSATFWWMVALGVGFYITFPLSVVRGQSPLSRWTGVVHFWNAPLSAGRRYQHRLDTHSAR